MCAYLDIARNDIFRPNVAQLDALARHEVEHDRQVAELIEARHCFVLLDLADSLLAQLRHQVPQKGAIDEICQK